MMWVQPDYELYYRLNPNDPGRGTIVGVYPDTDYVDPPEHDGMITVEQKIGEEFIKGSWSPSTHYVDLENDEPRVVKDTSVQRYLEYATIRSMAEGKNDVDPADVTITMHKDHFIIETGRTVPFGTVLRVLATPSHTKLPMLGGGVSVVGENGSEFRYDVSEPDYRVWLDASYLNIKKVDMRNAG